MTFSGTQKPTPPRVLDVQGCDLVHFEEEWSEYLQLSPNNLSSGKFFVYIFIKLPFLVKNLCDVQKNDIKFIFEHEF